MPWIRLNDKFRAIVPRSKGCSALDESSSRWQPCKSPGWEGAKSGWSKVYLAGFSQQKWWFNGIQGDWTQESDIGIYIMGSEHQRWWLDTLKSVISLDLAINVLLLANAGIYRNDQYAAFSLRAWGGSGLITTSSQILQSQVRLSLLDLESRTDQVP